MNHQIETIKATDGTKIRMIEETIPHHVNPEETTTRYGVSIRTPWMPSWSTEWYESKEVQITAAKIAESSHS